MALTPKTHHETGENERENNYKAARTRTGNFPKNQRTHCWENQKNKEAWRLMGFLIWRRERRRRKGKEPSRQKKRVKKD